MYLSKGSVVHYETFAGYSGAAVIESIEITLPEEKYGRVVDHCNTDEHPDGVVCLSNHHWCYFNQINQVLSNNYNSN